MVLELLLADVPAADLKPGMNELRHWSGKLGVGKPRFAARAQPAADVSHPAMAVNLDACIQCTRCVRACREEQVNDVIGYACRGSHAKIVFDFDDPMGESTCVACGECVQACPTGALAPAKGAYAVKADKTVDSVCPFCGVGCQLTYHVKDNTIVRVEGRDGPANHDRLCVKGRFGFDYAHHPHRLTKPLIRKPGAPKHADFTVDPTRWSEVFREATWEEALDLAAGGLRKVRDAHGGTALAGFGSAKGSNEEAYLFQKLVRTGFGSNNVDHCTRLCHASSVAALLEGIGSGAVSNQVSDVAKAEVIFLIGSNPTSNHPVAATWIKNAVKRGAKLILADPRRTDIARHAWRVLQFKPDMDVALLNAMIHTILEENLVDPEFIRTRTIGFEALKENAKGFSPEAMAPLCGIPAETIREVARAYATSKGSMILWGMGISQHVHGTDNARCLIALTLMTGQIGRPGTGLHPLRGQNNVQGASDAGLIPMMFPDYQRVDNPEANARFEKYWGAKLDTKPGLTVVEIMDAACEGKIRGMYVMGENPAMSDPNAHHAREGLAKLEHLVVQDIFLTETAYLADVVLPASAWPEKTGTVTNTDRIVQMGRRALDMPGEARQDLWITQEIAKRLGLDWNYEGPESGVAEVFEEMRGAMNSIGGISWERLEAQSSVTYPCRTEDDPGQPVVFTDTVPDEGRQGEVRAGRPHPGQRAARRRLSLRPHHRPPARALAHRLHDAPRLGARRPRAARGGLHAPARPRRAGRAARRRDHGGLAARRDLARGARRRRHAAGQRLHPLRLLRGGGQPADQPRARPLRQDRGAQVLRGEGDEGRQAGGPRELRRRPVVRDRRLTAAAGRRACPSCGARPVVPRVARRDHEGQPARVPAPEGRAGAGGLRRPQRRVHRAGALPPRGLVPRHRGGRRSRGLRDARGLEPIARRARRRTGGASPTWACGAS